MTVDEYRGSLLSVLHLYDRGRDVFRAPTIDELQTLRSEIECALGGKPAEEPEEEPWPLMDTLPGADARRDHACPAVTDPEVAGLATRYAELIGEEDGYVLDMVCAKAFSGSTIEGVKRWLGRRICEEERR